MNVSSVESQRSVGARAEVAPLVDFSSAVVAKIIAITAMFALSGGVTGWLLSAFPGLR